MSTIYVSTEAALIFLGILCVVAFLMYVLGEYVGYRRGVEDEARRHETARIPFWKKRAIGAEQKVCTVSDGMCVQFKSHGWERGHPMLDGMCFKCGFDEKTCECKEPDVQNPRKALGVVSTLTKGLKVEVTDLNDGK